MSVRSPCDPVSVFRLQSSPPCRSCGFSLFLVIPIFASTSTRTASGQTQLSSPLKCSRAATRRSSSSPCPRSAPSPTCASSRACRTSSLLRMDHQLSLFASVPCSKMSVPHSTRLAPPTQRGSIWFLLLCTEPAPCGTGRDCRKS